MNKKILKISGILITIVLACSFFLSLSSAFAAGGEYPADIEEQAAKQKAEMDKLKAEEAEKQAKDSKWRQESIPGMLETINKSANLPTFSRDVHRDAPSAPGIRNLSSIIFYALDFLKYIIGGICVVYIVIGALQIILSTSGAEETYKKQKDNLLYAIVGLFLVILGDTIVKNIFYGERGEVLSDIVSAQYFAEQGSKAVKGVYSAASYFAGTVAILMIIYYAIRLMAMGQKEEEATKNKKAIVNALIGLVIIGISELVIKGILFKDKGTKIGYGELEVFIIGITNFVASFIGILSLVMFFYAGILYLSNMGNEEATTKAKSIIKSTVLGILLALAAFAFSSTLIALKS